HQTWALDRAAGCWRFDVFREPHEGEPMSSTDSRRRRRRIVMIVLAVVLVGALTLAGRLFVWPSLPPLPQRADAIVQLGGPGNRRAVALNLVREGRAPL